MLILKRDPVTVGAALNSLLAIFGIMLEWTPVLTGSLIALVTAVVAVIQAANVFGTDKFTAVAVNVVGAGLGLMLALNMNVNDDVQTAIIAAVPILLGLFARNGVTNKVAADGSQTTAEGRIDYDGAVDPFGGRR